MWTPEMRAKIGNALRDRPGHKQTDETRVKIGAGSRQTRANELRACKMNCGFESNHGAIAMHERQCGTFRCLVDGCEAQKHKGHGLCNRHHGLNRRAQTFGLTVFTYLEIYEAQERACALCRTPGAIHGEPVADRMLTLAFDHCHTTGKFRSLLCSRCNTGLGWFQENPTLLRRAADYIEKHS